MASREQLDRFQEQVERMEREAGIATTDALTLSPFTRSILADIRRSLDGCLNDIAGLREVLPEPERDEMGSHVMAAKGVAAGLLGLDEDGA